MGTTTTTSKTRTLFTFNCSEMLRMYRLLLVAALLINYASATATTAASVTTAVPADVTTEGAEAECDCSCVQNAIPGTSASGTNSSDPDADGDAEDTEGIDADEYVKNDQEAMAREMHVETTNLTSVKSKKVSTQDDRPSAQAVGYLGIAMLGLTGGIVLAFDFNYVIQIVENVKGFIQTRS